MQSLEEIAEQIHQAFETRTAVRDRALTQARTLTRHCANAIRATHRQEEELARQHLDEAKNLAQTLQRELAEYLDIYFAGYTQDALKEYAEAVLVYSLTRDLHQRDPKLQVGEIHLPGPQDLELPAFTYLLGLAEAASELRRCCLDALLHNRSQDAEICLQAMDEIYAVLVTMDYPDAITGGLRRLTDLVRGVTERTRGDVTLSLRQERLEQSLRRLEHGLDEEDELA
jgi:translin